MLDPFILFGCRLCIPEGRHIQDCLYSKAQAHQFDLEGVYDDTYHDEDPSKKQQSWLKGRVIELAISTRVLTLDHDGAYKFPGDANHRKNVQQIE